MKLVLYDAVWKAIFLVVFALGSVPVFARHKLRERHSGFPKGSFLWLHGASLGECKMLSKLLQNLRRDFPTLQRVLLTTNKAELLPLLKTFGFDAVSLAPLDERGTLETFFKSVNPKALILAENELWPGLLKTAKKFRVPVALVSGRLRRRPLLFDASAISFATFQTPQDLRLFKKWSRRRQKCAATVGGNWKLLGQTFEPLPETRSEFSAAFASVHFAEWHSIKFLVGELCRQNAVPLLAPRRLEELPKFRAALQEARIKFVRYPQVESGSVTLVETFGVLPEAMKKARAVVVGGSFCRRPGIHDFWEPLSLGKKTFVGPYARGQEFAVAELKKRGAVFALKPFAKSLKCGEGSPADIVKFPAEEARQVARSYAALRDFLRTRIDK